MECPNCKNKCLSIVVKCPKCKTKLIPQPRKRLVVEGFSCAKNLETALDESGLRNRFSQLSTSGKKIVRKSFSRHLQACQNNQHGVDREFLPELFFYLKD